MCKDYSLRLKINHKLSISRYLYQTIKFLQLSTMELQHHIQMIVEKNPLLEYEEKNYCHYKMANKTTFSNIKLNRLCQNNSYFEYCDDNQNNIIDHYKSLNNYLLWQLTLTSFTDIDRIIAIFIIDSINNMGYLTCSLTEIQSSIGYDKITIAEIEIVRQRIQRFDPIGVGSHDLKEYLLIQLSQLTLSTIYLDNIKFIIQEHMNLLAKHNFTKLMRVTGLKKDILQNIISIIKSLNPYPNIFIDIYEPNYIIHDVSVYKINKRWVVELNTQNIPILKINKYYASMKEITGNNLDNKFIRDNLYKANLVIKSLENRNNTLLNVTKCIVNTQQEFFEYGEKYIKPMILDDIAKIVNLHVSTISRITKNKYLFSPQGTFELKYFFSNPILIKGGVPISSKIIKQLVKNLILEENSVKPLSDKIIVNFLSKKGIIIARRTIAKYRKNLKIPSSHNRKQLI